MKDKFDNPDYPESQEEWEECAVDMNNITEEELKIRAEPLTYNMDAKEPRINLLKELKKEVEE